MKIISLGFISSFIGIVLFVIFDFCKTVIPIPLDIFLLLIGLSFLVPAIIVLMLLRYWMGVTDFMSLLTLGLYNSLLGTLFFILFHMLINNKSLLEVPYLLVFLLLVNVTFSFGIYRPKVDASDILDRENT